MIATTTERRLPNGAESNGDDGTHFRVWAPKRERVSVEVAGRRFGLNGEKDGYFSGHVPEATTGDLYRIVLDDADAFPDPASRYQPDGPHGPSQIIDPASFTWNDAAWPGVPRDGHVVYEMHVGTFSAAGTYVAAAEQLPWLADLGVTLIELLPVAEFSGAYGWGYDGVNLFAPFHHYGTCDDLRAFVDRAHQLGLGVILDVVYNHFGPDGNYLSEFTDAFASPKHNTEWGAAINYDGPGCEGVREFVLSNVRHWIAEYHLDGLRIDAAQDIHDESEHHILAAIGAAARQAAGARSVILIAESEPQDSRLVRAQRQGGYGLDARWCDDFHHLAVVAATGRREAYYTDYAGEAREFVAALKHGVLYQGQRYSWQKRRRGFAAWDVPPAACVFYLQNHDQVANSLDGRRLHQIASPGAYRALTAVLLLAQQMPMLFQGQEFGASSPFFYFADHNEGLHDAIRSGRAKFLHQFRSIAGFPADALVDPFDRATFERSRLDHSERLAHPAHVALHRDLIALRKNDPVLRDSGTRIDGAVLGDHAFVIRYFGKGQPDRLLVVNLDVDFTPTSLAEPLLAPLARDEGWKLTWSSEDVSYGGRGVVPPESRDGSWLLQAQSAALLVDGAPRP